MRLRTNTLDRMIAKAKKLWGISEWDITYLLGEVPHEAEIDLNNWIEHRAVITFDEHNLHKAVRNEVYLLVVHEVGHVVIAPIWRGVSDWIVNRLTDEERETFEESVNTRENEVLGFLMARVLKV